ncbi:hypothetical protein GWD52_06355 [Enterobacteriaceae bacterium 4M9]|nr:hypothetical protein [Enterobacteriaceae bacterium 4M9]
MKLIKYSALTGQRCLNFSEDARLWRGWGLAAGQRRIVDNLFQMRILPEMALLKNADSLSVRYPWCFMASHQQTHSTCYFHGAFLPTQPVNNKPALILYTTAYADFLTHGREHSISLSFWLARALAGGHIGP